MTAQRSPMTLALVRRLYRASLWLLPSAVRRGYQTELIATFESASADVAAASGALALWRLLAREVRDCAGARRANELPRLTISSSTDSSQMTGDRLPMLDSVSSRWRQSFRALRQRPAFFAAAVLTLGVGMGLTTAVFSLVDTVLIKPLPYPDADQLVTIYESRPASRERTSLVAPPRLEDWQRLSSTFVALSSSYPENVTDASGEAPERLDGRRVTSRYFAVFAVPPAAGRVFTPEEERESGPGAAVISDTFWARRFHRDAAAIGRALSIGGRLYTIVGVMPATFTAASTDVWLPAQISATYPRDARFLGGVGRVRPGVAIDAAARDLVAVQTALAAQFPKTDAGWSVEVAPLKGARIGQSARPLVLVFAAVVLLLAIAAANIAGLTLVQMQRRARELAVRAALGASRAQTIGLLVREGLIIAITGGALGVALAAWCVPLMRVLLAKTPRINELALDWRALAFAAAACMLAALAFALVPALAATRPRLAAAMSASNRSVAGGRHILQKTLVVAQVALSVLLVGSATALLQNYYTLTHAATGFDTAGVMTFHVGARWDEDRTRVGLLQTQLLDRLSHAPHVQAAGMTNFLPAIGATLRFQVKVDGIAGTEADGSLSVGGRTISVGYLRALHVPLVAGEWCPAPSVADFDKPRTAMVNQRFVETFAPGANVVGRMLHSSWTTVPTTIVGVVSDVAEDGYAVSPSPYLYGCDPAGTWPDPEYVARTADAVAFGADLRRIVKDLDPSRAVFGLRPVQDVMDGTLDEPRLDAGMLALFAGAAVTLAAIGLYSLFMLVVSERARDIAVRLALGAAPSHVSRLVIAGAGRLLVLGLAAGIALTAAADRVLASVLAGIRPLAITSLVAAVVSLALVALVAIAVPAIRASRIAPIQALRGE